MALDFVKVDRATGKLKRVPYSDTLATSTNGQTDFTGLTTLTASSVVEVLENGVEMIEDEDYTRNVGASKIVFTEALPANARVRIRIWAAG